ncbi:MAG: hypothetical protein ACOY46_01945 [Bacillota bacterium]
MTYWCKSDGDAVTWDAVLDQLARELPGRHVNFYFQRSRDGMEKDLLELRRALPGMKENEIKAAIARWVASAGDTHTNLWWQPERVYPLTLYWFKDGYYVTHAAPGCGHLLNSQLVEVNGKCIEEIEKALARVIAHENRWWLKRNIPLYLVHPEVMHGLGIAPDPDSVLMIFRDTGKQPLNEMIHALPVGDNSVRAVKAGLWPQSPQTTVSEPLYLKNRGMPYWFEHLPDTGTVYFQYNVCLNDPDSPLDSLIREQLTLLRESDVGRLIIDLRHNNGGNSRHLQPFIREVRSMKHINRPGGLYVIVGRETFSAGMFNALQFREATRAIFVGEPTGGIPNGYGEVMSFQLAGTNLYVSYSTKYLRCSREDSPSFVPDRVVELTFTDYMEKKDPVLEHIFQEKSPHLWRFIR